MVQVNQDLRAYVKSEILPLYDAFDAAHRRDHVCAVIDNSLSLARIVNESDSYREEDGSGIIVSYDMVYAIAAYHDTGLCEGRENHHTVSARIIRNDARLKEWFTSRQIEIIADAAEDHRASSKSQPRSIYGRIVAEADRIIDPDVIIRRTIQYGLSHYPELDREGHYERASEHLHQKYGDGGYLKLWIPESPNAANLEALRAEIRDEKALRQHFDRIWLTLAADRV